MNVHLKLETLGHFINGAAVADGARTQPVFNPASGQVVREVSLAARATVEQAIAVAAAAFPAWRDTPPLKRARIMFRFKDLLEQNAGRIAARLKSAGALTVKPEPKTIVETAPRAPEITRAPNVEGQLRVLFARQGRDEQTIARVLSRLPALQQKEAAR